MYLSLRGMDASRQTLVQFFQAGAESSVSPHLKRDIGLCRVLWITPPSSRGLPLASRQTTWRMLYRRGALAFSHRFVPRYPLPPPTSCSLLPLATSPPIVFLANHHRLILRVRIVDLMTLVSIRNRRLWGRFAAAPRAHRKHRRKQDDALSNGYAQASLLRATTELFRNARDSRLHELANKVH